MAKKTLEKTALLQNADGSIYHLNLLPGELAKTIILVGDPERVASVSKYFDRIDITKQNREFVTHTGTLRGQLISVISTGIGTDNIDIVINECDALHNIDFNKRRVKDKIIPLHFLRLGTCGGIGNAIAVDTLVLSQFAVGFDGLMHFYQYAHTEKEQSLLGAMQWHFQSLPAFQNAYVAECDRSFAQRFESLCQPGITLTCSGFYGPQYRALRAPLIKENILKMATQFSSEYGEIANVEMETAGIYALSQLLGHQACSISLVIDNRLTDTVSKKVEQSIEVMIAAVLPLV